MNTLDGNKRPQVFVNFESLEMELDLLDKAFHELEARLSPVLRSPQEKVSENIEPTENPETAPLAASMHRVSIKVQRKRFFIESIISKLEI
jgi:hypothetical protein